MQRNHKSAITLAFKGREQRAKASKTRQYWRDALRSYDERPSTQLAALRIKRDKLARKLEILNAEIESLQSNDTRRVWAERQLALQNAKMDRRATSQSIKDQLELWFSHETKALQAILDKINDGPTANQATNARWTAIALECKALAEQFPDYWPFSKYCDYAQGYTYPNLEYWPVQKSPHERWLIEQYALEGNPPPLTLQVVSKALDEAPDEPAGPNWSQALEAARKWAGETDADLVG